VRRAAPLIVLVFVTTLEVAYGRFGWSWLAGPVAALLLWAVEQRTRLPHSPAPARRTSRAPAPVD